MPCYVIDDDDHAKAAEARRRRERTITRVVTSGRVIHDLPQGATPTAVLEHVADDLEAIVASARALTDDEVAEGYPRAVVAGPDKPQISGRRPSGCGMRSCPELERLRLLSRLDGVTLEALCTTYPPMAAPRRGARRRGADDRARDAGP
jgi:hypothetical protein